MLKNKKNIFILILIVMSLSGIAVCSYRSKKNKSIELTIVGDIMLSRGVDSYIKKSGYDHLYENMKDIFLEDDLLPNIAVEPIRRVALCLKPQPIMQKL